jgi:hypothetical protein
LGEPDCSSGFDPGFLHSLLRGGRNYDCVSKIKSQDVRRPFLSKKNNLNKKNLRKNLRKSMEKPGDVA